MGINSVFLSDACIDNKFVCCILLHFEIFSRDRISRPKSGRSDWYNRSLMHGNKIWSNEVRDCSAFFIATCNGEW